MLDRVQLGVLGTETSAGDVRRAAAAAARHGLAGLVVWPSLLRAAEDAGVVVTSVAGFPTGKHHSLIKAAEARLAVQYGAAEVGLVVDPVTARVDANALLAEVVAVREAVPPPAGLSVVVEAALLDHAQLATLADTVRLTGADRIIVGTGYHHLGGADPADVEVLAAAFRSGSQLGLDAMAESGAGDEVEALLEAGADRVIVPGLDSLDELLAFLNA